MQRFGFRAVITALVEKIFLLFSPPLYSGPIRPLHLDGDPSKTPTFPFKSARCRPCLGARNGHKTSKLFGCIRPKSTVNSKPRTGRLPEPESSAPGTISRAQSSTVDPESTTPGVTPLLPAEPLPVISSGSSPDGNEIPSAPKMPPKTSAPSGASSELRAKAAKFAPQRTQTATELDDDDLMGSQNHDLPSSRLRHMYAGMPDLIQAIEDLQRENMRIRFKAVGQLDNLCQSWFSSAGHLLVKNCFGEWKEMIHKKHEYLAVQHAIVEAEKKAMETHEATVEEQQQYHDDLMAEYVASHTKEINKMHREHKDDLEGFAVELEAKLREEHTELLDMHLNDHATIRVFEEEKHKSSLQSVLDSHTEAEKTLVERKSLRSRKVEDAERELHAVRKKLNRVQAKVDAMEDAMNLVRSATHGFEHELLDGKTTAAALGVEDLLAGGVNGVPNDEREYITEALHEILEQVDPSYTGRKVPVATAK